MNRQIPKNIRQIGNVSDSTKIYIEDYVDTFFNQLCEKGDQTTKGAFLVGEVVQQEEESYIYVYGAIRMQEVQQKGREIHIQDSTWKNACEVCKEYFGDAEILGWFLATTGQPLEANQNLLKVHQKLFSREKSILILKDMREKEEKYFLHKYRDLMECGGHYIYYEKNIEMQNYMISTRKKTGMSPSEIIEDTVTKNFRSVVRNKMSKPKEQNTSRFTYALSTFLVLVVVVIGVTMVNNYEKMQGVQGSIDRFHSDSSDDEKDKAVETLGTVVSGDGKEDENSGGNSDQTDSAGENLDGTGQGDGTQGDATQSGETQGGDGQHGDGAGSQGSGSAGETNSNSETSSQGTTSEGIPQPPVAEKTEVYIVEKGDTLATISREIYGDISHVKEICELNGLEDGNLIMIGQKLLLP